MSADGDMLAYSDYLDCGKFNIVDLSAKKNSDKIVEATTAIQSLSFNLSGSLIAIVISSLEQIHLYTPTGIKVG